MKIKVLQFCILIPFMISSCHEHQFNSRVDCDRFTIGKAVPLSADSTWEGLSYRQYVAKFAMLFNISEIMPSENDTTVRVWFWQGRTVYLLNIEKKGIAGKGHVLSFECTDSSSKLNSSTSVKSCYDTRTPIHGWTNLFDSLSLYSIASIPDGQPNDRLNYDLTEGGRIYLELQQGIYYRFYSYLEPGYYQFVDSNAGKFHHVLSCLQHELNLNVYDDLTKYAVAPIRSGDKITFEEYRIFVKMKFIDSGERLCQVYGDYKTHVSFLTDKRIAEYYNSSINGDSLYNYALFPTVREIRFSVSSIRGNSLEVTRSDHSMFSLRLGVSRQQMMNFFDSAEANMQQVKLQLLRQRRRQHSL